MRRLITLAGLLALSLLGGLWSVPRQMQAFADGPPCDSLICDTPPASGSGTVSGTNYVLTVSGVGAVDAATGDSAGPGAVFLVVRLTCGPGAIGGVCTTLPAACPQPDQLRYLVLEGTVQSGLAPVASICLGPADVVPLVDVQADVAAEVRRLLRLSPAQIHSSPPASTLVNLATAFWATQPAAQPVTATVDGASVQLSVSPAYSWSFGDGATASDAGPGTPYVPGADPPPDQDPAAYLTHTYAGQGPVVVRLSVVWSPSYTIEGVVGTFTTQSVTIESVLPLAVASTQGVLTGNS